MESVTSEPTVDPIVKVREDYNRLRGRVFEALEATGMPEAQCTAIKRVVRRLTYDSQASLEALLRQRGF